MKIIQIILGCVICLQGFCQQLQPRRTLGSRLRRSGSEGLSPVDLTINELRGIWVGPQQDIVTLSEKAVQNDPDALYDLSIECLRQNVMADNAFRYFQRAVDAGSVKAQLVMAIGLHETQSDWERGIRLERFDETLGRYSRFGGENHFHRIVIQTEGDVIRDKIRMYYNHAISSGYKCVTNLLAILEQDVVRATNEDAERRVKEKERAELEKKLRLMEARQTGKSAPFVPFAEFEKMEYAAAAKGAKGNDGASYYWLAYYFWKGEIVRRDHAIVSECLRHAVALGYPQACYVLGMMHECWGLVDEWGACIEDPDLVKGFPDYYYLSRGSAPRDWMPDSEFPSSGCVTNVAATTYIISLYSKAVQGGFPYATNDIARVNRKARDCEMRIANRLKDEKQRNDGEKAAMELLEGVSGLERREERGDAQKAQADVKMQEMWESWPMRLDETELLGIKKELEERFRCSFADGTTTVWKVASGKSCICFCSRNFAMRINAQGMIEEVAPADSFEEIRAMRNERERVLCEKQSKWAKDHDMTLEESMKKYEEWRRRPRSLAHPSFGGGLLRNRQQGGLLRPRGRSLGGLLRDPGRQNPNYTRSEEEGREEQRQQLLAIQEELRRVREAKAAAVR